MRFKPLFFMKRYPTSAFLFAVALASFVGLLANTAPALAYTQYYSTIGATTGVVGDLVFLGVPNSWCGIEIVGDNGSLTGLGGGTENCNGSGEFIYSGADLTNNLWWPVFWTGRMYLYFFNDLPNFQACSANKSLCSYLADGMAYFDQFGTHPAESWDTPVGAPIFDEINFTAPLNYLGQPPQSPYFLGDYSIATSSNWNTIRIKLSQWRYATSSAPLFVNYFDTALDYGTYQSGTSSLPFLTYFGTFHDGYYNYDAEFTSKNWSTNETISEGGYSLLPYWFWVGLTEANPYVLPFASTTPVELCDNIEPESVFDVVNGVQLAICKMTDWLFFPSDFSVQHFQNLSPIIQQKAPFAYFYSVKDSLNNLSASSTPAFALASSTGALNTAIFQPLKTGLTWILWILFAFWCIKRVAKFDF
jgi:hypothetical protein